eukprot:TRINITY_DN12088_c2_g1_i6.p1 TRINITY_DN12088_c2_g1~~TRINITY_DN12088_c2_g1_i6.p1  ORF type:complete len:125 (-),score=4.35 TRINITY_DN12088_c2_g1_i6:2-376(-)
MGSWAAKQPLPQSAGARDPRNCMQQADHQTYRRGAGAAWLGAFVQALMAALLFIYGLLARDFSAVTAGIMITLGIPVWIFLAIVLDQHRRERLESIEADALEQEGIKKHRSKRRVKRRQEDMET